ncbi:hypothetical protein GQ600_16383 [Phytophthora cactorum]|nr:hypothetical protein GQ600_16383 [Phytophthora cactorum]
MGLYAGDVGFNGDAGLCAGDAAMKPGEAGLAMGEKAPAAGENEPPPGLNGDDAEKPGVEAKGVAIGVPGPWSGLLHSLSRPCITC